jgi:hypothetical protein
MMAHLIATDDIYIHNQCQQSILHQEIGFMIVLLLLKILRHRKGLAMINGAAMPPQLTVKPTYNTSASTKALMVQHPYQAWLTCSLMIQQSLIDHKHA